MRQVSYGLPSAALSTKGFLVEASELLLRHWRQELPRLAFLCPACFSFLCQACDQLVVWKTGLITGVDFGAETGREMNSS